MHGHIHFCIIPLTGHSIMTNLVVSSRIWWSYPYGYHEYKRNTLLETQNTSIKHIINCPGPEKLYSFLCRYATVSWMQSSCTTTLCCDAETQETCFERQTVQRDAEDSHARSFSSVSSGSESSRILRSIPFSYVPTPLWCEAGHFWQSYGEVSIDVWIMKQKYSSNSDALSQCE